MSGACGRPQQGNCSGCERCGSLTFSQQWHEAFGVALCHECRQCEGLISKSHAKSIYLLSDKDLKGLGSLSKQNPNHKEWSSMKLYLRSQVEALAHGKYGNAQSLMEERHARVSGKVAARMEKKKREEKREQAETLQLEQLTAQEEERERTRQRLEVYKEDGTGKLLSRYSQDMAITEVEEI